MPSITALFSDPSVFRSLPPLHCARSLSALVAPSNPSLSFPFSLLSLLLLRHVPQQAKSQPCFRREPLVLSAVTGEERSQLARKGV